MKYEMRLYKYIAQHKTINNTLLRKFIEFIEEEKADLSQAHTLVDDFKQTEYFSTKKAQTQHNYSAQINRFINTIYEENGYTRPREDEESEEEETTVKHETKIEYNIPSPQRDESNGEYQQFLKRYNEICQRG